MGCAAPRKRLVRPGDSKSPTPSGEFLAPVRDPVVLSGFGPRGRRLHTGLDIVPRAGRRNGPVYASRAGRVITAGRVSGYGKMISIKHDDGYVSRYGHLSHAYVHRGQEVRPGQRIGLIGSTGNASAAHVHFEIITPSGSFVDPKPYIFRK